MRVQALYTEYIIVVFVVGDTPPLLSGAKL